MKVNYCGKAQQERMIKNGWMLELAGLNETPERLYERLTAKGYKQVKVYWEGTRIRGIRERIAVCRVL